MPENDIEKRERILKMAVQLFGREGYYGTRMSEVASKARVSPKTLYKFFSGKKELFTSALDYATRKLMKHVLARIPTEPDLDSLTIAKHVLTSYSSFIRQNRGLARIHAEAVAMVDPDVRRDQSKAFAGNVKFVAAQLKEDAQKGRLRLATEPEDIAWMFLSFASLVAYAVLLDLDRDSHGGFDPEYALGRFIDAMGERS